MNRKTRSLFLVLFVAWLFAVYAVFYSIQKPFSLPVALAALRTALDVATALFIVALGAALGRRILVWLGLPDLPPADLIWLAPGLGLGALSLIGLGLGLVGGWRPAAESSAIVYGLGALGAALLAQDGLALGKRLKNRPRPKLALGRWHRRYLLLTLALTLLLALAPPTSWDGLFYHLTGPALYIARGRIAPLDVNIPHLAFPSLMETLFGLAMLARGDVAAKLLHLVYGLLLAALIHRVSARWQGRDVAGWSLILFAAMPMVAVLAAWAYNDLALAFYQIAALYALLAWREAASPRRRNWLWAAGILSGLALGLKYTTFPLPLVGLAYLLWKSRRRWREGLIFALLTGLVAAPWYLRNWAFTGNPVYPFLFGGRGWDGFRAAWYAQAGTGVGWHPPRILALPVTMTLGLRDVNYYDGRMGPLFLALAPALIWLVIRNRRSRNQIPNDQKLATCNLHTCALVLLGGFAAIHALVWTLGVIQSRALFQARLFLPGFVALVPLLAESVARLSLWDRPTFSISSFVHLLIGVTLALNLVGQTLDVLRIDPLGYLIGHESRAEYLRRNLGDHYLAMETLEEIVPEEGRVLFLWEPRSYYSPRDTQPDAILDNWSHLAYLYGEEDTIAAHLRGEGFSHVLLYRWGLDFVIAEGESPLPPGDVERLQAFIEKHLELIDTVGSYEIYGWRI